MANKEYISVFIDFEDGTVVHFKAKAQILLGKNSDGRFLEWLVEHDDKKILAYGDDKLSVSFHHLSEKEETILALT
jgi:hypothetical protein